MARDKGTFDFAANLEGRTAAPIDARMLVETTSDLVSDIQWQSTTGDVWTYPGMIVSVYQDPSTEFNGLYRLTDSSFGDFNNWEKIGAGGGTGDISFVSGTDVDNRVLTANGDSSIRGEANLTFTGSVLTIGPSGDEIIIAGNGVNEQINLISSSFDNDDSWIRMGNDSYDWLIKYMGSSGGSGGNEFVIESSGTNGTSNYYRMDHEGNFEIGTPSGIGVKLTSDGNVSVTNDASIDGNLYVGGQQITPGGGGGSDISFVSGTDVNNRILTANGDSSIRGEANLTFDGTILSVQSDVSIHDNLAADTLDISGQSNIKGNLFVFGDTEVVDITSIGTAQFDGIVYLNGTSVQITGGPLIFPDNGGTGLIYFNATSGADHRLFLTGDSLIFQPNSSGSVGEVNFSTGAWSFNSLSTTVGGISSNTSITASTYLRGPAGSTTTPSIQLGSSNYGLFASGTSYMGVMSNNAEVARFYGSGNFHADGDVIANSSSISDIRLKENIEPLTGSISKIKKLDGKSFNFKGKNEKQFGFIAQEVEKVLPEVVKENEIIGRKDKYKTIRYQEIIPHLVEAIKEQQEMIETLKEEIEQLKKK